MKFKALSLFFPMKKIIQEEHELVMSCGGCHHNSGNPKVSPDLRDTQGTWQLNSNGFPVTGILLPEQFDKGTQSPALAAFVALWSPIFVLMGFLALIGLDSIGSIILLAYLALFFMFFGALSTILVSALVLAPSFFLQFGGLDVTTTGQLLSVIKIFGISGRNIIDGLIYLVPAVMPLLYLFFKTKKEAAILAKAGNEFNGAVMGAPRAVPNLANYKQDSNDLKDKSHFIKLGTATGRLAKNGDELAPQTELPFGLKTLDLSMHLITMGNTGSGKTTSVLRPVFAGIMEEERLTGEKSGFCVLDGKAQLPNDFKDHIKVIHPSTVKNWNPRLGLSPELFARTLTNIYADSKAGGNAAFFNSEASSAIFYGAVFHEALVEGKIENESYAAVYKVIQQMATDGQQVSAELTPDEIKKNEDFEQFGVGSPVVKNVTYSHPIIDHIQHHPDYGVEGTLINDAVNKFMAIQALAPETRSSIFATVSSWMSPLMQSKALRPWAESVGSDFDFERILYGEKFGFNLPEAEFGVAGIAITALMKARLFQLITVRNKKRKELGQSKVYLMVDEAQRIVDRSDESMIAVAREWGLSFIYATQNYESLVDKFGESGTEKVLDSFKNLIFLNSNDKTKEYAVKRVGKAYVWTTTSAAKTLDFALTSKLVLSSPMNDASNPYSGWMKWNSFGLARFLSNSREIFKSNDLRPQTKGALTKSQEPEYIVRAGDLQALNEPGVALAVTFRAGVPRRDIIKTQGLDENFKPFVKHDDFSNSQKIKELFRGEML